MPPNNTEKFSNPKKKKDLSSFQQKTKPKTGKKGEKEKEKKKENLFWNDPLVLVGIKNKLALLKKSPRLPTKKNFPKGKTTPPINSFLWQKPQQMGKKIKGNPP